MKIKYIEFKNFRNFSGYNRFDCSTDGKVTIVYGRNGVGKTTLQQLMKWVIYGEVTFDESATDKLYNLTAASKANINDEITVEGAISFVDNDIEYRIKREHKFIKKINNIHFLESKLFVTKRNEIGDYLPVNEPESFINKILPKGLSSYFFFDGEGMVKDLSLKGRDSAKKLKEAIYQILDLDLYDKAIDYIGDVNTKSSALGIIHSKKVTFTSPKELQELKDEKDIVEIQRDENKRVYNNISDEIEKCNERIKILSEIIGSAKSQKELEADRNRIKEEIGNNKILLNQQYKYFGEELFQKIPKLVIATSMEKAGRKIKKQSDTTPLINGLNKELVDSLIKREKKCVCGRDIFDAQRTHLNTYYDLLPPKGYNSIYQSFIGEAERWKADYNKKKIDDIISTTFMLIEKNDALETDLQNNHKLMLEDKKYDSLVIERQQKEIELNKLTSDKEKCNSTLTKLELELKSKTKKIDDLSKNLTDSNSLNYRIELLEEIRNEIKVKLFNKSSTYSRKLEKNIQLFLDKLMDADRKVIIDENFAFRVIDSNGDESKSKGQLAIVTFAFIGALFDLLKEVEFIDYKKEFPLIVDAPFSHLDEIYKKNVGRFIPQYAPQIIVFSKDPLDDVFPNDYIGLTYTITSNREKNDSKINKGVL